MQAPYHDQSVKLHNGVCSFCRTFQCFWNGNDHKKICAYIFVHRSTFDNNLPWPKYVNIADPGPLTLLRFIDILGCPSAYITWTHLRPMCMCACIVNATSYCPGSRIYGGVPHTCAYHIGSRTEMPQINYCHSDIQSPRATNPQSMMAHARPLIRSSCVRSYTICYCIRAKLLDYFDGYATTTSLTANILSIAIWYSNVRNT